MVDERQVALTKALMTHFEAIGVSRREFFRLLARYGGGVSVAALIAACGGAGEGPETPAAPAAQATPTSATASPVVGATPAGGATPAAGATPQPSGQVTPKVLVFGSGQDISNLDPHVGHDYSIASNQRSVYDTLVRYQGNPPEIENVLATEYESNEDASEWTFKLDPRAVFHDGTPVKASDVVYSVGRLIRKNKGPAWMFVNVMGEQSADAIDDRTVKFTLNTPFAPLPLILPWLFIVNEKVVREHDVNGDEGEAWLLDHEAGSGPFIIKRWQPGDSYEFEALPDYWWGWPKEGRLAGYIWKVIRESSSLRLALLNRDVHMVAGLELNAEDVQALMNEPGFHVNNEPGLSVFAVKLNNQRGPTSDVNVRKAISYAMDYEAVIQALNGRAVLLEGPLPPPLKEYISPNVKPYRHDMDKAREYLAKSQYPNGGFELEYVYVVGLDIEEVIGLILLDKLSQLNITVRMQSMVWPDMVARAKTVESAPDMMAVYSGTSYADPDNFLWQAYHSSQAGFWAAASHYKNPQLDKLLEAARAAPSHDERVRLYHQATEILVNDAVEVWIQSQLANVVWSDAVGGYRYCPIMGFYLQPLRLKE